MGAPNALSFNLHTSNQIPIQIHLGRPNLLPCTKVCLSRIKSHYVELV